MTHPSGFPRRVATLVMPSEMPPRRRRSGSIHLFRITSELAFVADAGARIHEICLRPPFTEDDASDVALCVREALSNVVEHAYGGRPGHAIDIVALCSEAAIVVGISDEGRPVAPSRIEDAPDPVADDVDIAVQDLPERGRGLAILHALLDSVRYRTTGRKNVLCLVRRENSPKRA